MNGTLLIAGETWGTKAMRKIGFLIFGSASR